jgi:general secretion pathway protein D
MSRSFSPAPLLVLLALLSGCAGQQAYRDGRELIAQNQVPAGLQKLQEALQQDPGNAQYRSAYLQARERATSTGLQQAERQAQAGQGELARAGFLSVLEIDAQNERASSGLRALERGQRQGKLLAEAQKDIDAKRYDQARQRLNAILTEQPNYTDARALLREVDEKTAPPVVESGLAKSYKQPITIEFRDAPLKQVFELIARRSGLNFVFDKDVKADAKTSIFLKNSTVESAVYFLLVTNQLEQQVMDANTILIYPNVAAKLKEYQEVLVKTFFLANADAKQVANTLKTILKTRDVVADEKLNLVIVRDTPEAIRLAERLIALQDVPEAEVVLELEILEVKRSRLLELGVAWPSSLTLSPLSTSGGAGLTINDLNNLNQRTIGVSNLAVTANANKTDGDANILANPRIRVRNREKAKFVIGDRVPVVTTTISPGIGGFASESISYLDVGLTVNAEPTIYLNNEVGIRISLEVSNLGAATTTRSGSTLYQIGTRQASTMLQLKDGENQVLAGLLNNEERSSGNKVPGLGDIPVLGRLFGSSKDDSQKTEIVLSITPHLVRTVQRPEAKESEFSAGTEGSFRRRPDMAAKAATQMPGTVIVRSGPSAVGMQPAPAQPLMAPVQVPPAVPQTLPQSVPAPEVAPSPEPAASPLPISSGQPVPLPASPLPLSSSQPVPVAPPPPVK